MKKETPPPASHQDFPVVGIGASAGGLDAFKKFLKAIPEESGMAYVLVQHLDPRHESILPDLLAKVTKLPVHEITDDIHLAPNTIYVIPSNKILTTFDGVLKLSPRETKTNFAIDVFFTSLAEVHQNFAVGVVLSGTGSDGTLGLAAIKKNGGITIAQKLESAAYDSMPKSAADAEVVDFILSPEEIPKTLLQLAENYRSEGEVLKDGEPAFKQILILLKLRSGVDFAYYKQTTVKRRVARRVVMSKATSLEEYLKLLRGSKTEQDALFQDMLIPVTSFFRDPKIFEQLSKKVFPLLFKNKSTDEPLRLWSAGCSTGEEAFSIAICLTEFLGNKKLGRQVQIFASDISEKAIAKARSATFSKKEIEQLPEKYLKKYFTKSKDKFVVNKSIRDMCVFAVQNFLKDPPFAKMDFISCRNSLIYMDTFLQGKALGNFHYSLNKNGFLLLGKSETTSSASSLFTAFDKTSKIYSPNLIKDRFAGFSRQQRAEGFPVENSINIEKQETVLNDFRKSADLMLSKFIPANVVVNDLMDIVHIQGEVSTYIEPSQGKPTFNLIKMARTGLGFELRNAIHKAKSTREPVIKEGIPLKTNGKLSKITIEIIPLPNTVEPHYLVVFRKTEAIENSISLSGDGVLQGNAEIQLHIEQLEKELSQNREDMRSITEDQEASNEELQSSNEELLSGSEELQSLNEELESSKEELQSTNEELMIVNQEFIENQEQLRISQGYTEAIIATLREPLVVLDKSLRVKTANASFYKKFNIVEEDVEGKLIFEIRHNLFDNVLLRSLLEKILPERSQIHDYEILLNLSPANESTILVNASTIVNGKSDEKLILLSLEDISERRLAENERKAFSEELKGKVKERTRQLEQLNMQLDQFSHTTSHEFQEPLRKIVIFSKILQEKGKFSASPTIQQYLGKIEGASLRMTKLIEDMLNFASVTQYEKLLEKTDLNEILKNILFDFELLILEKNATITYGELPVIEAVPFQMNQLFYDLIHNALNFSRKDTKVLMHISSRKLTASELKSHSNLNQSVEHYELLFKDNGIGFNQKYAGKIFTMFQRLSHNGNFAGTGIGLAICKKTVEQYNGEIFAEGKENEGAVFHVILPVSQPIT